MKINHSAGCLAAAAACLAAGLVQALTPLGTVFTYQGRLTDNGSPANGSYPMTFTLYDLESGGNVGIGPTPPATRLHVQDGRIRIGHTPSGKRWDLAYEPNGNYFYIDEFGVYRHMVIDAGTGRVRIGRESFSPAAQLYAAWPLNSLGYAVWGDSIGDDG